MSAKICWSCQVNLAWKEHDSKIGLGDDNEKPCIECYEEARESAEQEVEDSE